MTDIDEDSLKNVEKVHDLIKRMASGTDDRAQKEADEYLNGTMKKKSFDRTIISKSSATSNGAAGEQDHPSMSQQSFMSAIEQDAQERNERCNAARAKADKVKIKANEYFKASDYQRSLELYSNAIDLCKDYDVLYTNRAQTYLKLDMPELAVADCDLALFLKPNNHKAHLHKGKALVRLGRYEEALRDYESVLKLVPKLLGFMREFVDEATALQQRQLTQQTLRSSLLQLSEPQDQQLQHIVESLSSKSADSVQFQVGGLELLISLVNQTDAAAARESLCLSLSNDEGLFHPDSQLSLTVTKVIGKSTLTKDDCQLLLQWLRLMEMVVNNNKDDLFIVATLKSRHVLPVLDRCISSDGSRTALPVYLCSQLTRLLHLLTRSSLALQHLLDKYSVVPLLELLLTTIHKDRDVARQSLNFDCLRNLVDSNRFKTQLSKQTEAADSMLGCVAALLGGELASDAEALSGAIMVTESLVEHSVLRQRVLRHAQLLPACLRLIEDRCALHRDPKHGDVMLKLLRFMHNLIVQTRNCPITDRVRQLATRLVEAATAILADFPCADLREMSLRALSVVLHMLAEDQMLRWCEPVSTTPPAPAEAAYSSESQSLARRHSASSRRSTDRSYLHRVCHPLGLCLAVLDAPSHPLLPVAAKILALAARVSSHTRILCCDDRDRVVALYRLLQLRPKSDESRSSDEVMAGNVCLLFSASVDHTPLAEHMAHLDDDSAQGDKNERGLEQEKGGMVMRTLLTLCGDGSNADCRRNAAVLAGKLAQANHEHRRWLQKLRGFGIISRYAGTGGDC